MLEGSLRELTVAGSIERPVSSLPLILASPVSMRLMTPLTAVASDPLEMANFIREWGCRLANTEKNTGSARFAFNAFQRAFFPLEYKCPVSVIGNNQT
jgi:hypothetical protein